MAALTTIHPDTAYPQLGIALFVVGIGLGLAFTVASDVILASVPRERAGAAAAVSETAYELGMALGIATLGSIITAVYRNMAVPQYIPAAVAEQARDSLAAAGQAAEELSPYQGAALLDAARVAFTDGLAIAAGVGAALMLTSALTVWILLRQRLPGALPGHTEVGMLDDPGVHGDPRGDGGVDAAGGAEGGDRHGHPRTGFGVVGDARPLLPEDQQAVPGQRHVLEPDRAGHVVDRHDRQTRVVREFE
jgi:MFS transporter, DHA2 family, multidrug resistance protein